eukprot:CAMPEP_0179316810 /NCGR_PEP_ID=MMETSP0797-20121207/55895_1 /TAXON_ID=47934 /ORGANISM="Dinophysis acuminata, Strain DAEP01" /LENGTH=170 /DNA_ID=CAMNT_0021027629 /DNA_START=108 /DNA_END=617 /DNA_ORIENTATION=+
MAPGPSLRWPCDGPERQRRPLRALRRVLASPEDAEERGCHRHLRLLRARGGAHELRLLPREVPGVAVDEQVVDAAEGAEEVVEGVEEDERRQGPGDDGGDDDVPHHAVRPDPRLQGQADAGHRAPLEEPAPQHPLPEGEQHRHEAPLEDQPRVERVHPADGVEGVERRRG